MKLLVATRADENIKEMTDLTHPIIKRFAASWGADFLTLDGLVDLTPTHHGEFVADSRYHFRILRFHALLNDYDRIVHLDSDIVMAPLCPNLFDAVPEHKVGSVLEDAGSRQDARRRSISVVQQRWGDVNWSTGYINTGVFVVSRMHQPIFTTVQGEHWTDFGSDDVHLGWQIHKHGFEVYALDYRFNHMSMFSESWNGSPNKYDSYIIHYAGRASRSLDVIREDIAHFYA